MKVDQRMQFEGGVDLQKSLEALEDALVSKILTRALKRGGQPIVQSAAALAPDRTGALKASLTVKTKTYRNRKTAGAMPVSVAIIGPEAKVVHADGHMPSKAAHLVERGHIVRRKKGGEPLGFAPPRPFLRPALDANRAAALEIMAEETWAGIQEAVR